jgi:hypothetical protein
MRGSSPVSPHRSTSPCSVSSAGWGGHCFKRRVGTTHCNKGGCSPTALWWGAAESALIRFCERESGSAAKFHKPESAANAGICRIGFSTKVFGFASGVDQR